MILTLKILSPINNPALYAMLFGWISQTNNPYLFPPANRIPMLDVSVKKDTYLVPVLNKEGNKTIKNENADTGTILRACTESFTFFFGSRM